MLQTLYKEEDAEAKASIFYFDTIMTADYKP